MIHESWQHKSLYYFVQILQTNINIYLFIFIYKLILKEYLENYLNILQNKLLVFYLITKIYLNIIMLEVCHINVQRRLLICIFWLVLTLHCVY